jgi:DNA-binding MarR family transcriptional regulator
LEELGCIRRLPDPNDRRVVLIAPTEKGKEIADSLIAIVQEKLIGLVHHLGKEDSETLILLMSKMIAFLSETL